MLLTLFINAFLAATLLPFSSEILLITLVLSGQYLPLALWISATSGNVLGSVANWRLGFFLASKQHWFTLQEIKQAQRKFLIYGKGSLLLAWVPIIGDPLTFIAGVFRVPLWQFVLFMLIGKGGRYAVIIGLLI